MPHLQTETVQQLTKKSHVRPNRLFYSPAGMSPQGSKYIDGDFLAARLLAKWCSFVWIALTPHTDNVIRNKEQRPLSENQAFLRKIFHVLLNPKTDLIFSDAGGAGWVSTAAAHLEFPATNGN